jgi:DNA ligase (NAD+)
LIRGHDHAYHVLNAPSITDAEYDKLYRELVTLEGKHPELLDPNSPTQRIGGHGFSAFAKVKHQRKMLSLDNAFTAAEVLKFFGQGEEVWAEPKIDGLSLKVVYKAGQLVQAITRGNGEQGDDVTDNARTIKSLPLILADPVDCEVLGEVYMSYTVFNRLNAQLEAEGGDLFANARNAAAGTLKLKNPSEVAERHLSFAAHGCNTSFQGIDTHYDLIGVLEGLGFQSTLMLPVLTSTLAVADLITLDSEQMLTGFIAKADELRKNLDLPTDGLVFKLNVLAKQQELGEGAKSPNWAVAFKYPPERKTTILKAITLQVGKTGQITPVAELEPVQLSGTVVRRASLCNQDEIARLRVNVGDEVYVEKSAEIIPKVVGVRSDASEKPYYKMPDTCPCCGSKLVREEGKVDVYCKNRDCEEQVFNRIKHATGKACLDIDGCGEVMVRELMKAGVRKLSDVFALQDLSFIKPAASKRFAEGREKAKKQSLWRKLHALGIEGMGKETCQNIAARWDSLLSAIDELGALEKVINNAPCYQAFLHFFDHESDEINRLDGLGFRLIEENQNTGKLKGKIFAITGSLMSGSRDAVIRRVEAAGGTVKANVSKLCHYLVMGADAGRNKSEKAEKYGVPVITEQQLYELMGEPMPTDSGPAGFDPDREL